MTQTNACDPSDKRPFEERLDPVQYAKRTASWNAYRESACVNWTPRDEDMAKAAFLKGWDARKRAEIELLLEHRLPADNYVRCLIPGSHA